MNPGKIAKPFKLHNDMKTAEEILENKFVGLESKINKPNVYQTPLIVAAMKEYAQQKLDEAALAKGILNDERIADIETQLDAARSNAKFWEAKHKDCCKKYKALTTYVNERKV